MNELSTQEIEKQKKQSLKRYRKNLACIKRLEKKLAILDERITTVRSPNYSGMPRGGIPITIEDLMSDKMDLENRIKRLKIKGRDLRRAICEEIDSLEDPRYCDILEAHFIDCLSFEDIADDTGYTARRVIALYTEAIKILSGTKQ